MGRSDTGLKGVKTTPFDLETKMTTFLDKADDMKWLDEVHYKGAAAYPYAILYGNEDGPDKVELYARNHYQCVPTVLTPDADGKLVVTSEGEKPSNQTPEDRAQTLQGQRDGWLP